MISMIYKNGVHANFQNKAREIKLGTTRQVPDKLQI